MKITFKAFDCSFIKDPFNNGKRANVIVDIKDVPDNIPTGTNPRSQKMNTATVRGIIDSLYDTKDHLFHYLNRGIVISANDISFNEKTNEVTVEFTNEEIHGNIDGGHTYRAIIETRDTIERGKQYVTLEIITGTVIEENFTKLAAARNMSQQIVNKSIANLEHRFDWLKETIQNEPYAKDIAYYENAFGSIDVAEIIAIINMFDIQTYSDMTNCPTISFTTRKAIVNKFIDKDKKYGATIENSFYKLKYIIKDIISIYDFIETNISKFYKGKYGCLGCVKIANKNFKTLFYGNKVKYKTPKAFMYILTGAYRAIVCEDENGFYKWEVDDPIKFVEETLSDIVGLVISWYRDLPPLSNVQSIGKDKIKWQMLYSQIVFALRMKEA